MAASVLVILAPVLFFSHPALSDYQNHLARIWIIATSGPHHHATPFFGLDWRHINSDLGIDVAARVLRDVLPFEAIGRLCLAAAILLPPAGAIALNASLHGGLNSYQRIIPVFAWTLTALAGFLNFQIGLGLALAFVAIDPMLQRKGPWLGLVGRCACGAILFLDHALALLFYSLLLAGAAFGPEGIRTPGAPLGRRLLRALMAALTGLIPIIVITVVSQVAPGNRHPGVHGGFEWNTPLQALMAMTSPLITYDLIVDGIIAALIGAVLALAIATGRTRIHTGLFCVALALMLLQIVTPSATPQGGWTDRRLPVMALLTALSAARISFPGRKGAEALFSLMAFVLLVVRTSWVGWNWRGAEHLTEAVSTALESVPIGAAILPVQHIPGPAELAAAPSGRFIYRHEPAYRHLPAMAIYQRRAFVPTLFAQRGVHPVQVNRPWDEIAYAEGGELASVAALADAGRAPASAPYLRLWRTRFDYVLVLNADYPDKRGPVRLPPELKLEKDAGFATLYRIEKPTIAP